VGIIKLTYLRKMNRYKLEETEQGLCVVLAWDDCPPVLRPDLLADLREVRKRLRELMTRQAGNLDGQPPGKRGRTRNA